MDASQTTDDPGARLWAARSAWRGRRWPGKACGRGWCRCWPSWRCSSPRPISTCSPASIPGFIPACWLCWRWPSAALGWWRLRDFAWPTHEAAIRRLERDSGVPHRPLVAVQDRLAAGENDPMAAALWEAHRRREAARLAGLSNKPAHPGLAVLDTWALRFVPILLLIVAIAIAGGWRSRSHGCRLHAGLSAAAAGGRQSVDRAAGLYRQAADLSRHGRARQAPARAGRQQARGLRRRRARPQAAAAGDRRQGAPSSPPSARASTRSSRSSPRASRSRCRRAATSRRAGSCTSFPTWRRPSSSPGRSASTSGRPRSSTSPATISA